MSKKVPPRSTAVRIRFTFGRRRLAPDMSPVMDPGVGRAYPRRANSQQPTHAVTCTVAAAEMLRGFNSRRLHEIAISRESAKTAGMIPGASPASRIRQASWTLVQPSSGLAPGHSRLDYPRPNTADGRARGDEHARRGVA